jgi:hypothetical protein
LPHRLARSVLATAAVAATAAAAAPAAQAAPTFTCEASALRGTILGAATLEPVVYGRGQECRTGQATPPAVIPGVLQANVLLAAGLKTDDALKPAATAAGGLAGARVELLPSLPITLPDLSPLVDGLPDVTIPLGGLPTSGLPLLGGVLPSTATVSIKDAVRSLLPNLQLPDTDLLSTQILSSTATASCADGKLSLAGASTVTGLKILGQDVNLDGTLQQNVNVIDSANVDPSNVTVAQIQSQLPPAVQALLPTPGVTEALQAALQPLLDAIPNIPIPPTVAQVRLTAGTQTKDATSLTQQALRVQASVLGQPLADVVIGEAKVSAVGNCPKVAASSGEPAELQCTDRKLVLLDVFEERGRVRLRGAANRDFVGKTIDIKFRASGDRVVAQAKVASNGSFVTTAPLPLRKVRATNAARYTAVRGSERSLPLKLVRRMRTSSVTARNGNVTIRGRISLPLARPTQEIRLIRRVACGKAQLIKRFKPRSDGTFSVTVKASSRPAVYRATTRVRKVVTNPKTYPTFTLPRGIDLDTR